MRLRALTWALATLVPVIALLMSLLGAVAHTRLSDSFRLRAISGLDAANAQIDAYFAEQQRTLRNSLDLLSRAPLLEAYLRTSDEDVRVNMMQPELLKLFSAYHAAYPEYFEVRVLTPDGYEDTRSLSRDIPNQSVDESDSELYSILTGASPSIPTVVRLMRNPDTGRLIVYGGRAIYLVERGRDLAQRRQYLAGYLVLSVDLEPVGGNTRRRCHRRWWRRLAERW